MRARHKKDGKWRGAYSGRLGRLAVGEIAEGELAEYLLKTFPESFEQVKRSYRRRGVSSEQSGIESSGPGTNDTSRSGRSAQPSLEAGEHE